MLPLALPGSLMTCQHLGRNDSKHFPPRFPFLAGEFNEIGIMIWNLRLKVRLRAEMPVHSQL
jgi:hypothetical protein